MTYLDWSIVAGLNGAIIAYGFYLSRDVHSSTDWFLAGRALPWWMGGVSMYGPAIDSADLVADSGATYTLGLSYFTANWVGVVGGWALAGFFIFLPMYRLGMYTNAEYLEARFGAAARVICAFVQVQYRTLVLGIIGTTVFLTLSIVSGWDSSSAWGAVVAIAILASIYTAFGGLRSVAVTDALQFGVMTAAGLVIWFVVWGQVGGWDGVEQRLAAADAELPAQMLHVGHDNIEVVDVSDSSAEEIARKLLLGGEFDEAGGNIIRRTPAWLTALALAIMGLAYSIVNHTQSMRMFASRSEWDLKMSVFVASVAMLVMSFFNLSMGVMGRALQPVQSALPNGRQDAIYPYLVSLVDTVGLKGLVVAGILAAALSTYDSIGSSLSALLTRDVYARLFVQDRDDRHYLRVGQMLTPLIIALSFAYVPFLLKGGMVMFYLELTSTFVIPLLTLFLMGTLTRVHRLSGLIGLLAGALYGIVRLLSPWIAESFGIAVMPEVMLNAWAAYPISMLITAGVMVLVSVVVGWEQSGELLHDSHVEEGAWLRSSQTAARDLVATVDDAERNFTTPTVLAYLVVAAGCLLSFLFFW